MTDVYQLQRFVSKQDPVYQRVLQELRNGRKTTHWMWFVFPQLDGLGQSAMAKEFSIKSKNEARAYLDHALLGERLRECTHHVLSIDERTAQQIFGYPDYLKFQSCMTLFASIAATGNLFEQALAKYYDGQWDKHTVTLFAAL